MSMNDSQSWCLQHNHLKQLRHGLTVLEGTPCSDARYYSLSRPPMVRFEAYLVDTFADPFWYILPVLNQYQYFLPSLSFANMFAVQLKGAGTPGWDAEEHPFRPLLECYCKGIVFLNRNSNIGMLLQRYCYYYWNVIEKVLLLDCYWKWFRFRFQLWFRFHPKHVHGSDLVLYIWLKVQTSPDINFKTARYIF